MLIKTNVCNGVTAVSILFVPVRARTRVVKELLHCYTVTQFPSIFPLCPSSTQSASSKHKKVIFFAFFLRY